MSVRRLAEVQPEGFKFNRAMAAEAKVWLKKYPKSRQQSAVIPLLMLAQEQDGWVTKAAIEHVAGMLDMPLIRVLEVATFYTQFQLAPVGTKAHVQVCGTTPCMLRGAEELVRVCKEKIHPEPFHTNEDGSLSWEEVECQGACVNAPMVMIFKDTYEDLTPERLSEIIDAFQAGNGADVRKGPQTDRIFSAPAMGLTSLTGESGSKVRKGTTLKVAGTAKAVSPKKRVGQKVAGGNPTMKIAATASGRAEAQKASALSRNDKNRPEAQKTPAKPDDLKLISGVGPKIEKMLNELGVFSYAQIAKWKKAEREWVDSYLKFSGRIERDDWVKQAKALAKGGRDEYIRVFGKEPR
jgi:NADH-quinone oxidoreductase subunit E